VTQDDLCESCIWVHWDTVLKLTTQIGRTVRRHYKLRKLCKHNANPHGTGFGYVLKIVRNCAYYNQPTLDETSKLFKSNYEEVKAIMKVQKAEIGTGFTRAEPGVYTIQNVELFDGKYGATERLRFKGGTDILLNKTSHNNVIDAYGDETDNWVGKQVEVLNVGDRKYVRPTVAPESDRRKK
jgi:hypothetical protein